MDLFGPTQTKSLSGNRFAFVLVDDFLRFTWVFFLEHNDEAFLHFYVFRKRVEKKDFSILCIRSDRGGVFINLSFITYCEENKIRLNYLVLELHNKMESLKERFVLLKKWLGQ